jgi:O-antigen/teichoic acid export membrane protein
MHSLSVSFDLMFERYLPPFLHSYYARFRHSSLSMRLVRGAFWSLLGTMISRGLALIAAVFVARLLGAQAYGEFGIIRSTVGLFGVFAGFGLGLTTTKYVAEFRQSDKHKVGRVMALSLLVAFGTGGLMGGLILVLAPWLAENTLAAPHLSAYLQVGGLLLFFSAMNGVETGTLSGFEDFKAIASVNLWAGLANFPLMLVGVYLWGLSGAVGALIVGMALNWLLNSFAVHRATKKYDVAYDFRNCLDELPVLWRFSLPAVSASALVGPVTWLTNTLLVNQPNGYAELGIFNAADQWRVTLMFIPSVLVSVLLPIFSDLNAQTIKEDRRKFNQAVVKGQLMMAGVALPIGTVLLFFSQLIWRIYGGDYTNGERVFVGIICAAMIGSFLAVVGLAVQSQGQVWLGFAVNAIHGLTLLVSAYYLVRYDAFGLATSYVIAYAVMAIVFALFFRKYFDNRVALTVVLPMLYVVSVYLISAYIILS